MVNTKSLQVILSELRQHVRARNRYMDVSENSLLNDIIFTPFAVGGQLLSNNLELVKSLHVLSQLAGTDLDEEASNYGIERSSGLYATGYITFFSATKPTSDLVIPSNTKVRTAGTSFSSPATFTVMSEYQFALSSMPSYYSHDRGRYEFRVLVKCDDLGTIGNVGANLINTLASSVSQINGVTNLTATVGGRDIEDDDALRERVRRAKLGRGLNVSNGLSSYLLQFGFVDASVIAVEDPGYERASGADVFVIDNSIDSWQDSFLYDPAQQRYYLTCRPVLEVSAVAVNTVGPLSASQYSVNVDSTSPMRRSVYAQDFIELRTSAILVGSVITVSYTYSSLLRQTQQTLDLPVNNVITAGKLLKRAYPLYLFLNASLTLKANADGPTTRNRCRNALSQFLSTYKLGDDLQKSDLVVVLQNGYGDYAIDSVDAVVIPSYYLTDEFGVSYTPTNEVIDVTNKQHAVFGSATIV